MFGKKKTQKNNPQRRKSREGINMDISLATKGLFASNCTPKYKNWIGEIKMSKQTLNINEKAGLERSC